MRTKVRCVNVNYMKSFSFQLCYNNINNCCTWYYNSLLCYCVQMQRINANDPDLKIVDLEVYGSRKLYRSVVQKLNLTFCYVHDCCSHGGKTGIQQN